VSTRKIVGKDLPAGKDMGALLEVPDPEVVGMVPGPMFSHLVFDAAERETSCAGILWMAIQGWVFRAEPVPQAFCRKDSCSCGCKPDRIDPFTVGTRGGRDATCLQKAGSGRVLRGIQDQFMRLSGSIIVALRTLVTTQNRLR